MKVLVVSLLRLGDIVLSAPVLKGLKHKHKNLELHVLINKQFSGLKELLPYVDVFHEFDRKQIQKSIGEYGSTLIEPIDRLDQLVHQLNDCKFDHIINLTQNRMSGWLCGMVRAETKAGLNIDINGRASFGSPWFRYLNDQLIANNKNFLHYTDVFYYGADLPYRGHSIDLVESASGVAEAEELSKGWRDFVCVQPLTSDSKKNYGLESFAIAVESFKLSNPKVDVVLLGAPFEYEAIEDCRRYCEQRGVEVHVALVSLPTAFSLLVRAKALLTGDTAIKHLACATDCKILEIAIGSSDYRKTGVYKPGSFILQSVEGCHPCDHRGACHRTQHFCSQGIDPKIVGTVFSNVVDGNTRQLKLLAREYSDQFHLYQTFFNHSGFWYARNLKKEFGEEVLQEFIDNSSRKLFNCNEHKKVVGEFGSEGVKVTAAIAQAYPELRKKALADILLKVEVHLEKMERKLDVLRNDFSQLIRSSEKKQVYEQMLNRVSEVIGGHVEAKFNPEGSGDFVAFRHLQNFLQETFYRNQIKRKLVRTLKNQNTERF